jgi:hypothetical protein
MKMLIIEQKKKENKSAAQTTPVVIWAAVRSVSVSTTVVNNSNLPYEQWLTGTVVVLDVAGRGSGIRKWHHFPIWVCKHDQVVRACLQGIYTCTFHALFPPGLAPVFIILVTILLCIRNIGSHTPHVNRPVVTDYNRFSSVLYKFSISKTATDYE